MSRYRRAQVAGGTFFFTVVTYRRCSWLVQEQARNVLRDAIERTREKHPFAIDAWVLMPDNLHCIWTLPSDDMDFAKRWALIKRRVSMALGTSLHLEEWMTPSKTNTAKEPYGRAVTEHTIRDATDFTRCVDYLHYNPVKHGLVTRVTDWPWSSFHSYVAHGNYAADWGGDASMEM